MSTVDGSCVVLHHSMQAQQLQATEGTAANVAGAAAAAAAAAGSATTTSSAQRMVSSNLQPRQVQQQQQHEQLSHLHQQQQLTQPQQQQPAPPQRQPPLPTHHESHDDHSLTSSSSTHSSVYDEEDSYSYTSTSDSEKDDNGGDGSSVIVSYEQHIVIDPSVASNSSAAPYQGKFRKSTRRPLPSVINMEAIQEEEEEAETNSLGSVNREGDGNNLKVNQNQAAASPGNQRGEGDKSVTSAARRDVGSEGGGGGEGDGDDRISIKSPLHHHPSGDDQVIDISIEKADAEKSIQFEASLVSERNKRVLLARLTDIMPHGRLSLINLSRRNLGPADVPLLVRAIAENPMLSVLKLSYNSLGDEGTQILGQGLIVNQQHHQHLSVLDLGFNDIHNSGCEALMVHGVVGNFSLQTLYLSGNQITVKGAMAIAGAILHGAGLSKLYMSGNRIGDLGIKAIAGAIAKNDTRVTVEATSAAAAASFSSPATAIAAAASMDAAPVRGISGARRMEELHVSDIGIDSSGFIAIPQMLLSSASLTTLCVCNNNIGDSDMLLLSQALSQNRSFPLKSLRLSFNRISCQGVECLMNAIWGSETLREIRLDNNKIEDRGAQLCAVVLTSISLEYLDLSFNKVTTVGVKALMKNLSENSTLHWLSLCGIPIDQNASKAVSYALAYNASLKALFMDNCSTGYSSQRHIVAGIVSNRRSNLRVLTGFALGPIAMTLGMPNLPVQWSNDQVLGFFRLMWQQWLLKSGRGTAPTDSEAIKGPAPPAAVAAAAKIALSQLGACPESFFKTEAHEKLFSERSPVEPGAAALIERTRSGTIQVPTFGDLTAGEIDDWVGDEAKGPAPPAQTSISAVRGALDNPERRNRNLQWLRLHFRPLSEIGRLPFNNAELWQLHQYYFSPPFAQRLEPDKPKSPDAQIADVNKNNSAESKAEAPPPTPALCSNRHGMERAVSFQALGAAFAASGLVTPGATHKRRSDSSTQDEQGPVSKRAKSLSKPRIAWYPRIMSKIQSLGAKPVDKSLSLLRQLKYTENVVFEGRDPYVETSSDSEKEHADVEMVLLDLL